MIHDTRMLSIAGGYLLVLAVVVVWFWRQRRTQISLRWPATTTQRQMEQYGTRVLNTMGWGTKLYQSHATRSVYRCEKREDVLLVVFLRVNAFFARLLTLLRVHSAFNLRRTTIVLFDAPLDTMMSLAAEVGVSVINYTELKDLEELRQAVLPNVTAFRSGSATTVAQRGAAQGGAAQAGASAARA